MHVLLVYDSTFGNTEIIARGIADGLGNHEHVQVVRADAGMPPALDLALLIVGGPTQKHGLSPALRDLLHSIPRGALAGVPVVTFDTRYHMARWLTGSAARVAERRLRRAGGRVVAPPESFFMRRDQPAKGAPGRHEHEGLEHGEVERARIWGERLAHHLPAQLRPAGVEA